MRIGIASAAVRSLKAPPREVSCAMKAGNPSGYSGWENAISSEVNSVFANIPWAVSCFARINQIERPSQPEIGEPMQTQANSASTRAKPPRFARPRGEPGRVPLRLDRTSMEAHPAAIPIPTIHGPKNRICDQVAIEAAAAAAIVPATTQAASRSPQPNHRSPA